LALKEADATDKLFVLMRCGPPFAFEHSAARRPQPIEPLLQLAVCPGRQRLVDNVYQSFFKLGHGEARLILRQNSLHVSDQLAELACRSSWGNSESSSTTMRWNGRPAPWLSPRSVRERQLQPQVHPIGSPLFWRFATRGQWMGHPPGIGRNHVALAEMPPFRQAIFGVSSPGVSDHERPNLLVAILSHLSANEAELGRNGGTPKRIPVVYGEPI
jgi:hypothetical protein